MKPLDPQMPTQELLLHMGEMTPDEILVARAAIEWANTRINTPVKHTSSDENTPAPMKSEHVNDENEILDTIELWLNNEAVEVPMDKMKVMLKLARTALTSPGLKVQRDHIADFEKRLTIACELVEGMRHWAPLNIKLMHEAEERDEILELARKTLERVERLYSKSGNESTTIYQEVEQTITQINEMEKNDA